jgi:Arc/MetJ-type ribon-helix-helix transcriptional regulator
MNIRLNPHSEELLKEQMARGQFRSPEEVIERALETLTEREQAALSADLAEFDATLDAIAEGSEKLADLPDEAFSRQSIYQNHD